MQHPGVVLNDLLLGNGKIKRKPFKPVRDETYYSVDCAGRIDSGVWNNDYIDRSLYKLGNCYRTKEEAMRDVDKWVAFYNSDEPIDI